jgi:exonuclease III
MESRNIVCWNVHGLNAMAHRDMGTDLVKAERIYFVCLQDSKLGVISTVDVMQIVGDGFDYFFLLAAHT